MSRATYIIASHASWHRGMADRLRTQTGRAFMQVGSQEELERALEAASPRYVFFTHWSSRIPREIWDRHECVIFHMTDVPYGRGGSPLQNLIVRGHTDTVLSAIRCVADFDAGGVYLKRPLSLAGSAREIFVRAAGEMEEMIAEMVEREPAPAPQDGEPTIFRRRTPAESALTPGMTLQQVYDHIRMLDADGYPPAFIDLGALRLEFSAVTRDEGGGLIARAHVRPRPEPAGE